MYWDVVDVRPLPNYSLKLQFADGVSGVLQLDMNEFTGVLSALRNPEIFEQVFVDHGAVSWPGEIDWAPDALYHQLVAQQQSV